MGSCLTRLSSKLKNILEIIVQTRQTDGELARTSTHRLNPRDKERPVPLRQPDSSWASDLLYCVPHHAFMTSTEPTAPSPTVRFKGTVRW
jgi:hypothetical protein